MYFVLKYACNFKEIHKTKDKIIVSLLFDNKIVIVINYSKGEYAIFYCIHVQFISTTIIIKLII